MRVAVIGSRMLTVPDLAPYLPEGVTELVSGSAKGIDRCVREYAKAHDIKLTEFLPDYERYARRAPLIRNDVIINYADMVVAIWDGRSRGTGYVIERCREQGIPLTLYIIEYPEATI